VNPVVEAIPEIARPRMGVTRPPAREEDLLQVGLAGPLGVFQEERVRHLVNDDAAVTTEQTGRDAQLVGKGRDRVADSVAIGVLADDDAIVPLSFALPLIRIINGHAYPQPAALVPGHADRLAGPEFFLGDERPHLEIDRRDEVLDRLGYVERFLHLFRPGAAA